MKESNWKQYKFNDNNEALYCNAFERYFAPSSLILLANNNERIKLETS